VYRINSGLSEHQNEKKWLNCMNFSGWLCSLALQKFWDCAHTSFQTAPICPVSERRPELVSPTKIKLVSRQNIYLFTMTILQFCNLLPCTNSKYCVRLWWTYLARTTRTNQCMQARAKQLHYWNHWTGSVLGGNAVSHVQMIYNRTGYRWVE